jgi:hypothetical protein
MKYAIEVRPSTQRGRTGVFVIGSSSCRRLLGRVGSETNGKAPDGHLSVNEDAVRLIFVAAPPVAGGLMQYALLIYGSSTVSNSAKQSIPDDVVALLDRPDVAGWARLHGEGSATTLRTADGGTLLTDGPFVESKEFLGGLVVVEAENLDGALAIARALQATRTGGAIEVRPVVEGRFRAA